jgi:hypothetical protein
VHLQRAISCVFVCHPQSKVRVDCRYDVNIINPLKLEVITVLSAK